MKKVLLINTNTELHPYPVPPLGVCLLASVLKEHFDVMTLDGAFTPIDQLLKTIQGFHPDFICFGIRNIDNMTDDNLKFYLDDIVDGFIQPVRNMVHVPLIIGGSAFSIFPAELMKITGADYGIAGEGELTLPHLLKCLADNTSCENIPGIYIKGKKIPGKKMRETSYPFKKNSDIDLNISYAPYFNRSSYPIQTKRGCRHRCIYCVYPMIEGRLYRLRDPEEIAREVEEVYNRLGNVSFEFVDSTFNDPPGHAEEICRKIIKKKIPVWFRTMGINPLNVSSELITLMQKAGFRQIDCTPDSASPAILKSLKKNFQRKDIIRAAKLFKEANMPVMWFFLFGAPGETVDTIKETESFFYEDVYQWDMVHMTSGLRIYPGTELHRIAVKEKKVSAGGGLLQPVFYQPSGISLEEIKQWVREISLKQYNCILSSETTPSEEMMKRARQMQLQMKYPEPMYRTLLRIRKEMMMIRKG